MEDQSAKNERPHFTAADLFAGAGGLSLGFEQGGADIVFAVERDSHAARTYRANRSGVNLFEKDIRELDPATCMDAVGLKEGQLTALIGGPPCQGFSESNKRTRTLENPNNHYYLEYFRFLAVLRPQWFVIENVAGLRTLAGGALLDRISEQAEQLGYTASCLQLEASAYGVPQVRRRLFIVGNRLQFPINSPQPIFGEGLVKPVTVHEAISDLPRLIAGAAVDVMPYPSRSKLSSYQSLMRRGATTVQGNLVTKNSPLVLKRYEVIRPGQNWESIPNRLLKNYSDASRCHTGIYYRLVASQPSKVIGNFRKNMLIHPTQHRGLSVREAARIQSFPDDYQFTGSIGFQQQQVADAVPPLLAKAVAQVIFTSIVPPPARLLRDLPKPARKPIHRAVQVS